MGLVHCENKAYRLNCFGPPAEFYQFFNCILTLIYLYDKFSRFSLERANAGIAQSVVRRIGSAEVTGPIPVTSFFYFCHSNMFKATS